MEYFAALSTRCHDEFDPLVRLKGTDYFRAGRVSEPELSENHASFTVRGTESYRVSLDWSRVPVDSQLLVTCSCPHYADGMLCKHAWAALLKFDSSGMGREIPGGSHLGIQHQYDLEDGGLPSNESGESAFRGEEEADSEPLSLKPWLEQLKAVQVDSEVSAMPRRNSRLAYYALDVGSSINAGVLCLELFHQEILPSGARGAIKRGRVARNDLGLYSEALDRDILAMLIGGASFGLESRYRDPSPASFSKAQLTPALQEELLTKMSQTGRLIRLPRYGDRGEPTVMTFLHDLPWSLNLSVEKKDGNFALDGFLSRGENRVPVHEPRACLRSGILIFKDHLARLDNPKHTSWLKMLREDGPLKIPETDADELIETLCENAETPAVQWPKELRWKQEALKPRAKVVFTAPPRDGVNRSGLLADLRFAYGDQEVSSASSRSTLLDRKNRRLLLRQSELEEKLAAKLRALVGGPPFRVPHGSFAQVSAEILSWGWPVEAQGQRVRSAGEFKLGVASGVDWFDLNGGATFEGGQSVALPRLLAALQNGEYFISLGDGTLGMLPSEWLEKYSAVASIGEATQEGLRFTRAQGALLAGWLAEDRAVRKDADFSKLLRVLNARDTLKARNPAKTFHGELRPYQKEGLAWLDFLSETGFGGILADDMGLGKTVQLLAHLDREYQGMKRSERKPSLVILPKSLMFNWREEAQRFAPKLKVLSYAGPERQELLKDIPKADLVLATYSTVRMDAEELRKYEFHYVIADEAQAIKNAQAMAHQACLLMRGRHRLAMTGTPVENSMDDLFSILEFVSPGLIGKRIRDRMSQAAAPGTPPSEELQSMARALQPFILRRTKEQVLKDLPEKSEKVLHCELSTEETQHYAELRDYYRSRLKGEIARRGLGRSKIIVLEALLRLRQAACHPGLVDKNRINEGSTKVETLISQLQETISEGHKALVFSQFTSFMDIVGQALEKDNIPFERLDGQTSLEDRRERVSRFQEDPSRKVFLISLKAGGVGLNLTAADYVFILDPWWNPAVESQAIDRTHRIGQKNKVIAYRLIAKDTVEEKILELQKSKRELANAIISADTSLLRKLTTEDIELLLS